MSLLSMLSQNRLLQQNQQQMPQFQVTLLFLLFTLDLMRGSRARTRFKITQFKVNDIMCYVFYSLTLEFHPPKAHNPFFSARQ